MSHPEFVGYILEPDVHDGNVLKVQHNGASARVLVQAYDGRLFVFEFSGVKSVKAHEVEGMMLYSLSEMTAIPPLRRFAFTNWDEEGDGVLELQALEFTSCEIATEAEF